MARTGLVASALAALALGRIALAAPPPPVDAYGQLPALEQPTLSPDGTRIAFLQRTPAGRSLVLIDLARRQFLAKTRVADVRVRAVQWADDDHLLVTTASTGMPMGLMGQPHEWHVMSVYNLATRKWTGLLQNLHTDSQTMNVVYGRPVIYRSGGETLMDVHGLHVRDVTESALFRINLTSGAERLLKEGGEATIRWLVDDSGEVAAEEDYLEHDRRWAIRLYSGGRVLRTVSGIAPIDRPEILGLSSGGDQLIVALTESDGVTWKYLSIKDGTWGADISAAERLSGLVRMDGSERMIGTAFLGDATRYHFTDPALQEGWDWVTRVFGYQRLEYVGASSDHHRLLVRVFGPKSGFAYYLADLSEHLTQPIGNVYDGIGPIAEVRAVRYPAADGLEIPAYLTLPPDRPAKALPTIVFPHGGPEARDSLDFDWWAQAMASQGYAVLQPNYRGSALDKKWVEAGYGEWGRKMQTDLSDGLRYLADQGIADAQRACIVGASYGGYAALAGVSIQSGIYRCAVAVAGVSDPSRFLRWVMSEETYGTKLGTRYWERFLGARDPGDKALDAISPLRHADRIAVPVLLIHGRDDTTVPYDQSADLAKALKRAGKPAQFVTLDKEDHYLSASATRLQMLKVSLDFLRVNNPP